MPLVLSEKNRLYRRVAASRNDAGNDGGKRGDVEARAADQRPIDVGLARQLADILRFHAPAVDHAAELGSLRPKPVLQAPADMAVRLARLRRRRVAPGPDRPDRFVRDHELHDLPGRDAVEPLFDLAIEHAERVVALPLIER